MGSEETRVPVQPDEIITEPDEVRRVPDHPGTESLPTVDAFWDEGITDLLHLDSHSTGFVKRQRKSTYPGGTEGRVPIIIMYPR